VFRKDLIPDMTSTSRLLTSVVAATCLALSPVSPAAAESFPGSVPLPTDFQPEGIAAGTGTTFYVGSLRDGDIYRGDLRTGQGAVLVDVTGRAAVGLEVDRSRHMLFVAGGALGTAYVYDTRTGATLAALTLTDAAATFVNDVAVTRDAAYFTDSFSPMIYRVPLLADGSFGPVEAITVTGPAGGPTPGFGLNGIEATPDGSVLLVNHTDRGILATVDPVTGTSRLVQLTGGALVPGTPDGLVVRGRTAWVVQNAAGTIVQVRLSSDLASGEVIGTISSASFEFPTTAAIFGSRLAVVNAKFDLGFPPPLGPGAPPGTAFEVIVVRAF
jgi:sugar lactone lactonase YvrE